MARRKNAPAEPTAPPRRTTGLTFLVLVVVVLAAAFGVRALYRSASTHFKTEQCTVGAFTVDNDQASVAAQMVGVVVSRGLPERASVLTLAAALQESKLRNLAGGDRDSVGVLQQRPSQGWGTVAQISNIRYATGKFLDALVKLPDWQTGNLADTIQAVQISADGNAYAQHEPLAQALADALSGVKSAGINCYYDKPTATASAADVVTAITTDLPVNPPTVAAKTISVPNASWTSSAWFVANAQRFGVQSVRFSGQQWTRADGWKTDSSASAGEVTATVSG